VPKKSRGAARSNGSDREKQGIEGEALEPIRVVERELTGPDGSRVRVRVPVYPPFRLKAPAGLKRASGE